MIKGKTKSGFSYEIDAEALESMEFIDAMGKIDDDNISGLSNLIDLVMNRKQKKAFYDHIKGDRKYTPMKEAMDEFFEILKEIGKQEKN